MKVKPHSSRRVLSVDPTSRGLGYIVMEGQRTLIDWGVKVTRGKKKSETVATVAKLIRHYRPHVLISEDCDIKGSRRCERIRYLLADICGAATEERVRNTKVSTRKVKEVFSAFRANTKHQIAHAIAAQLPELAPRLPRYRKPWMSEDYRMAIFDAAAFALAYFYGRSGRQDSNDAPAQKK
jgi:5S rRNA maturation endonuclease (ribonuclease M5)